MCEQTLEQCFEDRLMDEELIIVVDILYPHPIL